MKKYKLIKKGLNKNKRKFLLLLDNTTDKYSVWIEKENYNRGEIVKSLAYVKKDMEILAAEAFFNKELTGKRR